ncbi:MAG: NAD(+)/NADH kinase [Erysipelotrichaceae bacterium]|nr:NAD(+)/NADH kinase [Erysipelotrichaceae bacterium]
MRIHFCPNTLREDQLSVARDLIKALENDNIVCTLSENDSMAVFSDNSHTGSVEDCDIIASLGGDGSVLRAAQVAIEYDKKLIGINAGRLGYLCAVDAKTIIEEGFDISNLILSKRSLLKITYEGSDYHALNDIVLSKSNFGSTITVDISCNQMEDMRWRGDGIIISTPTGSTSYSYAAGGPFVDPNLKAFIITPICPHLGSEKSIILSDDDVISLKPKDTYANIPSLYVDGNNIGNLETDVEIMKSEKQLSLLTSRKSLNYNKIRK